jgi:hypothetical protein
LAIESIGVKWPGTNGEQITTEGFDILIIFLKLAEERKTCVAEFYQNDRGSIED